MPTIGALLTLKGEDLRGSSHMIGSMVLLTNIQTASIFWGTATRQRTPPSRKRHSHKQQNSINVVEPPCKQVSKFGQADELTAIVDTDFLCH